MRSNFIEDTNFLIYVLEGNEYITPFLDYNFSISFITEIELLGFAGITTDEENKIKSLVSDSFKIEWDEKIKDNTIKLRRKYKIKLPDAIIAATAISYDLPLVTADKEFASIEELELVLLEL
jgi:hypothetical protein